MLVKNICLGLLLGVVASTSAIAATHTVSLGYGQSKIKESEALKNLKGVNAQYRFENQTPWGGVVSTSYLTGDKTFSDDHEREQKEAKYFSLLAGPAYRFNEYVSAYALAGFAHIKAENDVRTFSGSYHENVKSSDTGFAYGVGVSVNPVQNIAINVGYEGTKVKDGGENLKLNGFNIGVGYRF